MVLLCIDQDCELYIFVILVKKHVVCTECDIYVFIEYEKSILSRDPCHIFPINHEIYIFVCVERLCHVFVNKYVKFIVVLVIALNTQ